MAKDGPTCRQLDTTSSNDVHLIPDHRKVNAHLLEDQKRTSLWREKYVSLKESEGCADTPGRHASANVSLPLLPKPLSPFISGGNHSFAQAVPHEAWTVKGEQVPDLQTLAAPDSAFGSYLLFIVSCT